MSRPPILLTPGPVPIEKAVLEQLARPMIHHRGEEFKKLFLKVRKLLKKMFQTKQEVLILNASGTGAMSCALLNTLSTGDHVLVINAGRFGARWTKIAKAYKLKVTEITVAWGKAVNIKEVKKALLKNPDIKAVLAQACETSTGIINPVQKLAGLCKTLPGTLFILDSTSLLGASPLPMDQWGIDIMLGASQKTFCLPPGMAFICLSKKAWRLNSTSLLPTYYFDLKFELKQQMSGHTAFSTNVSYVRALETFLTPLRTREGIHYFIKKSQKLSRLTLKYCKKLSLEIFGSPPSPSVTAITLPSSVDGVKLKHIIEKDHRVYLGGGQEHLKGKIIRVGHIGHISPEHLSTGLRALGSTLSKMKPRLFPPALIKDANKILHPY